MGKAEVVLEACESPTLSDDVTPQSKRLVWTALILFSPISEVTRFLSVHLFFHFFCVLEEAVSLLLIKTKTSLSLLVLHLPLELDSFNQFLLLLTSSVVFLLLTSFPPHIHILSCPALLKETP